MNENNILKKKPLKPSLNKLFIAWVEEMKKDAKKNGLQSYCTFKKALIAIKKFPIKLTCGKDCAKLDGFGDKICANLDKKLADFAKNRGLSIRKALKLGNKELSREAKHKVQTYLPKIGSVSASLIVALNELHSAQGSSNASFKKNEVIEAAKRHCSSSFLDSEGKFISWNSMKTLLNKELVEKNGTSYKLTESGRRLYDQIRGQHGSNDPTDICDVVMDDCPPKVVNQIPIQLYYCKSLEFGDVVHLKSDAARKTINGCTYVRIKIKSQDLLSDMDYLYDMDMIGTDDDGFTFAFLAEKDAPREGIFVQETIVPSSTKLSAPPIVKLHTKSKDNKNSKSATVKMSSQAPLIVVESNESPQIDAAIDGAICPMYTMEKGSFEIILVVDTRENYGTGKLKEHLCPKLSSNGISFEIRPLPVGDFLWIAKDKLGREAVLDIIVERKRFDDLCASIMDNRFKDQKQRMKRLGIGRIVYLVEKCAGMKNLKIELQTLYQNLVNSEIHDLCDVKIAENGADTISYLSSLTRKLSQIYSNRSIEVHHNFDSVIRPYRNVFDERATTFLGLDFQAFSKSGQKTRPLRVSEMLAKHLMCIHGITPEKAKAVVDLYPSPRLLMEAYDKCQTEKDRSSLFSDCKLSGNRKFGIASSKSVFYAFNRK